ncbi:MAG: CYTH domain-containing protein [Acidobacteriota bacterium]
MGTEIERKFLLRTPPEGVEHTPENDWRLACRAAGVAGVPFRQGYLSTDPERNVRVRLEGERAKLTIKGRAEGIARREFEFEIPRADADGLFDLCHRPLIEKTRYTLPINGEHVWEIDDFHGDNVGLVVAEIELAHEDEAFACPAWLGEEVSHDRRYLNSNLVEAPYASWPEHRPGASPER